MRIAVDGRVMQDRYHGIGRHTFEVVSELARGGLELVVVVPPDTGRLDMRDLRSRPNVQCITSPVAVTALSSQWELSRLFARCSPDVLFIPYHLSTPLVHRRLPVLAVVHDCIFERAAHALPARQSAFLIRYKLATRLAMRSASTVATVSEATRQDLRRLYGRIVPPEAVLPHGVSERFFTAGQRAARRPAGVPDRYILHVGVRRPHKNQRVLVEALARLPQSLGDVGLVLVGQKDERFPDGLDQLIDELGVRHRVHQLSRVDDEQLLDLYAHAAVFAFPSSMEGFGLPLLEAMAARTPVVVSHAEAVVETSAGAARIVPGYSGQAWADALAEVICEPGLAAEMCRLGDAVAQRHTWARSADRTLALLEATAGVNAVTV